MTLVAVYKVYVASNSPPSNQGSSFHLDVAYLTTKSITAITAKCCGEIKVFGFYSFAIHKFFVATHLSVDLQHTKPDNKQLRSASCYRWKCKSICFDLKQTSAKLRLLRYNSKSNSEMAQIVGKYEMGKVLAMGTSTVALASALTV